MDYTALRQVLAHESDTGSLRYVENEPLSHHSTFRIGGPVDFAVFPQSLEGVVAASKLLQAYEIPFAVFGKGSNVLFSDEGYRGAILFLTELREINVQGTHITAMSGASFTALAAEAQKFGLSGLEFAYGIPGTVGGAVYMNAGAYGGEVATILTESHYLDLESGEINVLRSKEHDFSYRHSAYMQKNAIILSATFSLAPGDSVTIREKMEAYMTSRKEKQPLEYPSAGSTFKRPEGYFAGKLIADAGLKGLRIGNAQVSEKHAGFFINLGNATAADMSRLIREVRITVKEKFGVELTKEVIYFGEGLIDY